MIDYISVAIITKNAGATLANSLTSLADFSEVIVFDNGSEDNTVSIAESFNNTRVHTGAFEGFGPTKNKAVDLASNNWILSLDADEAVSTELLKTLRQWSIDTPATKVGLILRDNYFMGEAVRHGGWGNDWLVRLFNRSQYRFNSNMVHESIQLDAQAQQQKLKGTIDHNAVQHIGQFLDKVNRYSEIRQQQLYEKNKHMPLLLILLKTWFAFFRSYILQSGWITGWRGLVIAYSNANGAFFKYMKAYSRQQSRKQLER